MLQNTVKMFFLAVCMLLEAAQAAPIYNNLTPNGLIGIASRPGSNNPTEIETADDFILTAQSTLNSASITGLIVPGKGTPSISEIAVEIYRVFPKDSNSARTPNVPTRTNSPSDVAFETLSSANVGQLSFSSTILDNSFTIFNSVAPGGINPTPNQTTGGNGPLTGQEAQLDLTFVTPITLAADHYFFVVQVGLTNNGQFYWLSASRPINGGISTPFSPDLQAWTRDTNLDPDWLRVGTDIIGGVTPPTFNLAFSLNGTTGTSVPEPTTLSILLFGLIGLGINRLKEA